VDWFCWLVVGLGYNKKTMIIDAVLLFFSAILSLVLLLPSVDAMPSWYAPVHEIMSVFSALASLPFLGVVFQILMLFLAFQLGWQVVVFANWLYNKIRGAG